MVPGDLARVYNDLFERRQESDYADFVRFQGEQVRPWIPRTQSHATFIAGIVVVIND